MEVVPYDQLSALEILSLCVWREGRGEELAGRIAIGCSIRNRVLQPRWWNQPQGAHPTLWHATILKPWQYSSFNHGDPNETRWPVSDTDEGYGETLQACWPIWDETSADTTSGATHYYDLSISFPHAWGKESDWENTLNIGRLRFWKER